MSNGVMLFNPFTGRPRDPRNIASDPSGVLVWDGEAPLLAAAPSEAPQAEATVKRTLPPLPQCTYLVDEEAKRHGMHPAYRDLQNVMKYGGESTFQMAFTAEQMEAYARAAAAAPTERPALDAETWAELYRLREEVKGPPGYATWRDAAVEERHKRVQAEASATPTERPAPSEAPQADMLAVCAALGFDPTNHHNAAQCPYCRQSEAPQTEALPCPFCGHQGIDFAEGSTFRWLAYSCGGCGIGSETRIQTMGNGSPEEWRAAAELDARKAWNTRAAPTERPALTDALDAERYRWLREQLRTRATMLAAQALFWSHESRKQFDEAVDAALAEQQSTGKAPGTEENTK